MKIGTGNVGERMTIRYVVGGSGPSGGPAMTDVIGRILSVSETEATVERRDGSTVIVRFEDIVAAKTVPATPARSRGAMAISADNLTRIASRGWPAIVSEDLGDWELRASNGFTGRANSVAVAGSPGMPPAEAVAAVVAFYESHELRPMAQVVVGSPAERHFLDAGWASWADRVAGSGAIVQVADLKESFPVRDVTIEDRASNEWLSLYHRVEDSTTARAVLEAPATVAFLSIANPVINGPVAIGRVVVTGEWAGLACVEVATDHRREGLARRIVEASITWARERGADKAYLQTKTDNNAAIALYAPYGFRTHHEYTYLVESQPSS